MLRSFDFGYNNSISRITKTAKNKNGHAQNLCRGNTSIITYKEAGERFIDGFYGSFVITDSNAQAERLYYSSTFLTGKCFSFIACVSALIASNERIGYR